MSPWLKGTTTAAATELIRTSEPPRLHVVSRFRELWAARQILANLIRKEVKVKYKSSVLGVAWSMLNPILYLAVFTLVFSLVLRNRLPYFPVYLLSGLLAWNLVATSLSMATRSVVDNANLVTKVYFPREILPLASVGAASVDFITQAVVLIGFMVVFRYGVLGWNLLLLPLAMVALLLVVSACALVVAALNVQYRDTQHLLTLVLLTWFWLTPVVYPSARAWTGLHRFRFLYLANPIADVVLGFQRALYGVVSPVIQEAGGARTIHVLPPVSVGWLAMVLGAVVVGSVVMLWLAWRAYFHLSGDFAEQL